MEPASGNALPAPPPPPLVAPRLFAQPGPAIVRSPADSRLAARSRPSVTGISNAPLHAEARAKPAGQPAPNRDGPIASEEAPALEARSALAGGLPQEMASPSAFQRFAPHATAGNDTAATPGGRPGAASPSYAATVASLAAGPDWLERRFFAPGELAFAARLQAARSPNESAAFAPAALSGRAAGFAPVPAGVPLFDRRAPGSDSARGANAANENAPSAAGETAAADAPSQPAVSDGTSIGGYAWRGTGLAGESRLDFPAGPDGVVETVPAQENGGSAAPERPPVSGGALGPNQWRTAAPAAESGRNQELVANSPAQPQAENATPAAAVAQATAISAGENGRGAGRQALSDAPEPAANVSRQKPEGAASPAEPGPEPGPEPVPRTPARDITLRLSEGDQRVAVRLVKRQGEVRVEVRTPDSGLAGDLRRNPPSLAARLEQSGFHAGAWQGGPEWRRPTGSDSTAADQGSSAGQGRRHGREGRDDQPRRSPEAEEQTDRRGERKKLEWFLSSHR